VGDFEETVIGGVAQRVVDGPADRVLEDRYTDFEGDGGGGGGGATVAVSPYPRSDTSGFIVAPAKHPLRHALDMVIGQKPFSDMKIALVDLTDGVDRPVYVGYKDKEQLLVASIGKLAIMLAGFSLRQAARDVLSTMTVAPKENVYAKLKKLWRNEFARGFRGGSGVKNSVPDLPAILSIRRTKPDDPFTVDFTRTSQGPEGSVTGFRDDMLMSLKYSANDSSASCITRLGFPYINHVLKSLGFSSSRGFRLSTNFKGTTWDPSWSGSNTAATANAIADIYTRIARDRLIAPGLAGEYREIMATQEGGAGSLFDGGLWPRLTDPEKKRTFQGKVGYEIDLSVYGDSILMRRPSAKNQQLVYIAVALGAKDKESVKQAGIALDDCILLAHGEAIKPPANP
jgi:hypothetical protein